MEGNNSINSCMKHQNHHNIYEEEDEESGWSYYVVDDFFPSNYRDTHLPPSTYYSGFNDCTSSLVSDAASVPPWKFSSDNNNHHHGYQDHITIDEEVVPKSSSHIMKNNKKKNVIRGEDALEDTASSPVNSPKVSIIEEYHNLMKPRKNSDDINIESSSSQMRKTNMLGDHYFTEVQSDHGFNQLGFIGMKNSDCSDLKKKGLCLVPLSMVINYLG